MASAQPSGNRWLFGPTPDLLLGCGGAYALLVGVLLFAGSEVRSWQPAILLPMMALVVGTPHYGATLLRVYEHRADRRRYALFSLWATLLVAADLTIDWPRSAVDRFTDWSSSPRGCRGRS